MAGKSLAGIVELLVIVIAMAFGGILFWVPLSVMRRLSIEVQMSLSFVGAAIGAVVAYSLIWLAKRPARPKPTARPTRAFLPQVVGSQCAACEQRIMFVIDGACCPTCHRVYCAQCEPTMPCSQCCVPAELVE